MTSIEEAQDLSKISTDMLIGKLLTHELTIKQREGEKEEEKEKKKNDEKDEEKGVPNFWVTAVKTNGVSVGRDL